MADWHIEQKQLKTSAFNQGQTLSFVTGIISRDRKAFLRFSRSLQSFSAGHRVTLQYLDDGAYTPYVFSLNHSKDELSISPENQEAKNIWQLSCGEIYQELYCGLLTVLEKDIRNGKNI